MVGRATGVPRPARPARQTGYVRKRTRLAGGADSTSVVVVAPWVLLAAYAGLLYGLLPFGPAIGTAVQASAVGRWVLGPGAAWLAAGAIAVLLLRLRRRGVDARRYAFVAAFGAGTALGLVWLRAVRLERVHLPEYAIASVLAWRALRPTVGDRGAAYVGAALLAAAIGWGDELVQGVTPGRVYDLRDVAANAVGAVLGALALAVWRAPGTDAPIGGSS